MFFFGDPAEIAQAYIDKAVSEPGPTIMPAPLEEMSLTQLGYAMVYARVAYREAWEVDEAPQVVIDAILEIHDEIMSHMIARDAGFRQLLRERRYVPLQVTMWARCDELLAQYSPSAN